jgi:hypothetical protein
VQLFTGDKTIYRVRIGHEPDIQTVEKISAQLRRQDFMPFIVRVD